MHDYFLCGWRVQSMLPLPELRPWQGDGRAPDVEIRIDGSADGEAGGRSDGPGDCLIDAVAVSPLLQIDGHNCARLVIEGVASYLVREGRSVTIKPHADPAAADIRVFLFGTVLGLLGHQRGLLPLRAACVAVGNRAIALAGAAGRGKSTAAALLALRGHPFVADCVCMTDPLAPGGPAVLPGFPYVSLWRGTADALALPEPGRLPNRHGQEKYRYPMGSLERFRESPVPLTAVYLLEWTNRARNPEVVCLNSTQSAAAFRRLLIPRRTGGIRGLDARLFRAAAFMTNRCRVSRVIREYGFSTAHATSSTIEGLSAS